MPIRTQDLVTEGRLLIALCRAVFQVEVSLEDCLWSVRARFRGRESNPIALLADFTDALRQAWSHVSGVKKVPNEPGEDEAASLARSIRRLVAEGRVSIAKSDTHYASLHRRSGEHIHAWDDSGPSEAVLALERKVFGAPEGRSGQ